MDQSASAFEPMEPARFSKADGRAVFAVAGQFFINGALFASFVPRLPEIRDQVDIDVDRLGILLSVAGASGLLGSVVVTPLIARFGTRAVMAGAGLVLAASLPIIGVATTPILLLLGLMLMSTFDVLVDVAMNMQGSWLSARRHTPVMNRLHGLWSLGTVIGGVSSSRLAATRVSLAMHLITAAAILFVAVIVVNRFVLRTDEIHDEPASRDRTRSINPIFVIFFFGGLFAVAVEATSMDWAAFRFTDDFETGAAFGALGYVAFTLGMTSGRFAGDFIAHRLGDVRLQQISLALCGVGLTAATLAPQRHISLVGYAIAGLGIAALLPRLYDLAAKHRGGAGLGALTAGLRIAGLILPIIVGFVASQFSVGVALALVMLPSTIGFAIVGRSLEAQQQRS